MVSVHFPFPLWLPCVLEKRDATGENIIGGAGLEGGGGGKCLLWGV